MRDTSYEVYIVRGAVVGIPNGSGFVEFSPLVFVKERPLQIVDISTEKGGGVDVRLSLTSKGVTFMSRPGRAVNVSW